MVDGTALLMVPFYAARQGGWWSDERGTNTLDTGAPYYDTYECADGGYVAVGAIEPQFYAALLAGLELDAHDIPDRDDRSQWDDLRSVFAAQFKSRTRDEWAAHFSGSDACVAPILTLLEAPQHEHNVARNTFTELDGFIHPAPAPRLDRTPGAIAGRACYAGEHTDDVLREIGCDAEEIARLRAGGAVA
jgi:alpha-methylacyl-CoA racemase